MARAKKETKKEKKVLSEEEKLDIERQSALKELPDVLRFNNTPTYTFKVGDKVRYGAMESAIVEKVFENGKAYLLLCTATRNNYGNPYQEKCYRMVSWIDVRPIIDLNGKETISTNQDIKLYFNNSTIESLLHHYYFFGIDMNPDYQRDYVWDEADKVYLIDSVFSNIDIGKFVLIHREGAQWLKDGYSYEILDGKQRLNALIEFYENRFPYKGLYYNDLVGSDKWVFLNHNITYANIRNATKKDIYQYFLMLNRTGKQMDKAQLEKVEQLYHNCED